LFLESQRSSAEDNACLLRQEPIPALVGQCKNYIRVFSASTLMSMLCLGREDEPWVNTVLISGLFQPSLLRNRFLER